MTVLARPFALVAILLCFAPGFALAQTDVVTTLPPNIVVPNYAGVPAGPYGGLEASAYVARANDPSAAWFNPAGLSRSTGAEITGSAGLYQLTSVSPNALPNSGGSVHQVPNLVGFTFKSGKLAMGAAFLTTLSWQQETDSQLVRTDPSQNPDRIAYSANSSLSQQVAAFSAGYDNGKRWRLGGGIAISYTGLDMAETVSERIGTPTGLQTLLVGSHASGSTVQVRPLIGVQIEPTAKIRIGGLMRTSGFSVIRSGSATLDGTVDRGAASIGSSLFDASADFEYKQPFEVAGGVAYVTPRAEIEADVLAYSSIAPYSMFASSQPFVVYADSGSGTSPSVTKYPFGGLTSASRAMANVSVGGHVQPWRNHRVLVHFGIASDLSPVAPEDQVFDRVNFTAWTLGLSGAIGKLTYAAGVNYRGGTSDAIVVRNVLTAQPVETSAHITTIGMIYSLAYQF